MTANTITNAPTTTHPVLTEGTPFAREVQRIRAGDATPETGAAALVALLSDEELLWCLDGDMPQQEGLKELGRRYNGTPLEAGRIDRVGIPGIRFADGPRGVVPGNSTAFPVSISRAASWDVDLERRIGNAIGAEARAHGANLFAGVCVNVPPFPGWGRSQEAYGEDPMLTGAMGSALVEGVRPWVMACVKHYALNSMEDARFTVDVQADEGVMHEAYLPHFRDTVEAGVDAVMSSYNSVNGEWAGQNRYLLTDVLRGMWGFSGFVMTDFIWGLRDPIGSVAAGQDLEMPLRQQRARTLPAALADGRLRREDAVTAAERIVAAQLRLALRALPDPDRAVVASADHRALAREAAHRGAVLLRNTGAGGAPVLPLTPDGSGTIAVLGRLADEPNLGDHGSSRVYPPTTSSVFAGLRERIGERAVRVDDIERSADIVANADAAVVVVGMGAADEGEALVAFDPAALAVFGGALKHRFVQRLASRGMKLVTRKQQGGGDRASLHLHPDDVALIQRAAAMNERTIVVLVGGGTIMPDPWDHSVGAILLAWYPGMEGGRAIADILFGDAEPSGRLPLAIPARRADLPEVDWAARSVQYPRWFGQQLLDRQETVAAYPFGFGLGYSSFRISEVTAETVSDDEATFRVSIENTGSRQGRHVVQIYATQHHDTELPRRALIGFASVELESHTGAELSVRCSLRPLRRWRPTRGTVGEWRIEAASYAGDPDAARTSIRVTPAGAAPTVDAAEEQ